MQHSVLLFALLGFLVVAAAGVFLLVNQTGEAPVVQEEYLVGGIGLVENTILEKKEKEDQEKIKIAIDKKEKVQIRQEPVKEEDVEVSTQILPVDVLPEVEEKEEEKEEVQEEQIIWCEVNLAVSPLRNTIIFNEIAWMGTLNSFQDEWVVPQTIRNITLYS